VLSLGLRKMNMMKRLMYNEKGEFACEKQYEDIWGVWFDMEKSLRW